MGHRPVLELDDGTCIAECTAITEYLDHLVGKPVLTGVTPKERGIVHMMQRRAEAGRLDAVGAYFHHATPGLRPKLETYQNREWGEKSRERAIAGARYLNDALSEGVYLAGERFTMADVTAFVGLAFAEFAGVSMPKDLDALRHWRDRVAVRPSASHA